MKERISALMDGELERAQGAAPLEALREDAEARQAWRSYHVIGDAMRDTRMLSGSFTARVAERLAAEPTVMAPVARPMAASGRWQPMSLAAGVAGLAFAFTAVFLVTQRGAEPAPQAVAVVKKIEPAKEQTAQVAPPDAAHDYLLAHQGSSPRNSLQGMAPYVRMVSDQSRPAKP